mmetsp:Transcript_12460/g.15609  ORF Transcript_12460/g.15609 Transcript_12460/m.15609 type:complete len:231 (-) Transcript_12460:267-959(-)|eukprot:CAMPEP_0172506268 /NCGR_PEP_ID=MMETSP1066-20121228/193345_1 /TAXON_ID=671091 /ORGANISM="Coscinodiscus wailesii, Strain CCMP2513" /LENGTH=230 /DNA_ID=CAMNT_0013283219 /DNA_START=67 /DNA_END=759 /DNA_ORIENTATION=-
MYIFPMTIATNNPNVLTSMIYSKFFTFPQPVRFFASAAIGNGVLFAIDKIIYYNLKSGGGSDQEGMYLSKLLQENAETISFFISYMVQIAAQHFLNALLVFGLSTISTKKKYMHTLAGSYTTYFGSMLGTTFINTFLIKRGFSKNAAFCISISSFGVFNYFLLSLMTENNKYRVSKDKDPSTREVIGNGMKIGRGGAKYIMNAMPEVVFGCANDADSFRSVKTGSSKIIV